MTNPFAALVDDAPSVLVLACDAQDADQASLLARYGHWLPAEEHDRRARFTRDEPAAMFLSARIVLRGVLGALLHCKPEEIALAKNAWEKPCLASPASDWQFNLTHSHGHLALAFSRAGAVGVDTEFTHRSNPVEKLARRYFSAAEQQWLARAPESEFRQRFFDIWTLKEAYIKAVGKGLAVTLEGFSFTEREGRLSYQYDSGEPPPAQVSAWLSRALPERPLACVLLSDELPAAPPVFRQITLDGNAGLVLPVHAAL